MILEELRPYQDKTAVLHLHDGEIVRAKILLVDAEYEDMIVDILHSTQPEKYIGPADSAFVIRAADVASATEVSD